MAKINGTADNDRLVGGKDADDIFGAAGNDTLSGGLGIDALIGGDGNDDLIGDGAVVLSNNALLVQRLYNATLGRAPDDAGWAAWIAKLEQGTKPAEVAAGFVNSSEFQTRYGSLGNDKFINLLYQNVLGRAADAGGFDAWTKFLAAGGSRTDVVLQFANSAEFKAASNPTEFTGQIFRLYDSVFNREADVAGLNGWVEARWTGASLASIAAQFVASAEFKQTYGTLTNAEFVTKLYYNVLDRAPDADGQKAWTQALDQGRSRADVVLAFSESQEHVNGTKAWLNSFVDSKLADWTDTLNGGKGDNWISGGRGSDFIVVDAKDQSLNTIYGYESFDRISLQNFGYKTKADVLAHAWQQGDDVYFNDGATTVIFNQTTLATLQGTVEDRWFLS